MTAPTEDYEAFIAEKSHSTVFPGVDVDRDSLGTYLFPHQRDLVRWALKKGRAAVFADTGLGNRGRLMPPYSIVYADPPWPYNDKKPRGGAEKHYSTMTMADIQGMTIPRIVADDAVLFLWGTYPLLPHVLATIEAWGFTYKTCAFKWIKLNKRSPTPFFGVGHWTRSNAEPCFLAVRGSPKRISGGVAQIVATLEDMGDGDMITSPISKHSAKPAEVRERIVKLMGDIPRIELFARERVPGWDAWGNELPTAAEDDPPILGTAK